jgi:hypothetical protein
MNIQGGFDPSKSEDCTAMIQIRIVEEGKAELLLRGEPPEIGQLMDALMRHLGIADGTSKN